jgi:putative ABC transport system substrate-binding protein
MLLFVALPFAAFAQPAARVARIGYLAGASLDSPEQRAVLDVFRQGLREHGYVEGQNLVVDYRAADGAMDRLPGLAGELVRLGVDLIVAGTTSVARAAHQATTTIPIVAFAMGDPVGDGLVASLARPGGNVTGLTFLGPDLVPKRLELLKEALPRMIRLGALWQPGAFGEGTTRDMMTETEAAARSRGVRVQFIEIRGAGELPRAFATMARERTDAVLVFPGPLFFSERRQLATLAAERRLPSMFTAKEFVELGGLISYGASLPDLTRRSAAYVDRILKGTKPHDLPVEQPTTFELAINIARARTLGISIPPSLRMRADHLIE